MNHQDSATVAGRIAPDTLARLATMAKDMREETRKKSDEPRPRYRWEGVQLTPQRLAHMPVATARIMAYLAWAAAARRKVTRQDVAAIPSADGSPIGLREATRICEDLHDDRLVYLPGWLTATATTPMVVLVGGHVPPAPRPRPAEQAAPQRAKHIPDELAQELRHLDEIGPGIQSGSDVRAKADLMARKTAALRRCVELTGRPKFRHDLAHAEKALGDLREQAERNEQRRAAAVGHPCLDVACVSCTAVAGEPCVRGDGGLRLDGPHRGRISLHDEQEQGAAA